MKKTIFYGLLYVIIPSVAFAIAGSPSNVSIGGPDAACIIKLTRSSDDSIEGVCSGSLVAQNKVLTAAHFFKKEVNLKISVSCGFVEACRNNITGLCQLN